MAGGTSQTGLSLGSLNLLLDGLVEFAVEEDRVIVAAGAPFGRLDTGYVLHVLDRFAIPLVIERGKMVHG